MGSTLIHPLQLAFDSDHLEKSYLRHEASRLRAVDISAIILHSSTTLAAVLRDLILLYTSPHNMATKTRMIGTSPQHVLGSLYAIFNLVCVSKPWLRWTANRNSYLTAVRIALPLFHLLPVASPLALSQSYYTGVYHTY